MESFKPFNFDQQWNAESYNQHGIPQLEIALKALSNWNFQGNEKILDIGCGNGAISSIMAEHYVPKGSVLGIDLSNDMITFAEKKFSNKNLNFKALDASKIDFTDEFNLITSFYCMHWIEDKQRVIEGISKGLKDKGHTLLYMMSDIQDYTINNVMTEVLSSPKWFNFFQSYTIPWHFKKAQDFEPILKKANLKTINLETIPQEIIFKTKENLNSWLKAIPMANHLSPILRDDLMSDISSKYLDCIPADIDGSVKFILPTLTLTAQKIG